MSRPARWGDWKGRSLGFDMGDGLEPVDHPRSGQMACFGSALDCNVFSEMARIAYVTSKTWGLSGGSLTAS